MIDYRVISIGALSHHPLWNERAPVRTAHATTTLIRGGDRVILVDPGLPSPAVEARLHERSGLTPDRITDVFLTNFRPSHRAGLLAFDHAQWWISAAEREHVGRHLIERFEREDDSEVRELLKREIALLKRCRESPDKLADQVDLFPLHGYTPGNCGLLLCPPNATVLIASDAVATVEHLEQGRVLAGAYDVNQATESFREAIEIADWIIPGHDNLTPNLMRRGM